jgi:pilus assembly protein Flp/PilA
MKIPDREDGQGLVEYALMLALVAVVVIAILIILGPTVTVVYARVIGGFSGQSVTMAGGEVIVLGLEKDTLSGPPACGLTI